MNPLDYLGKASNAARQGLLPVVEELLKDVESLKDLGAMDIIYVALRDGDLDTAKYLVEKYSTDIFPAHIETAIRVASRNLPNWEYLVTRFDVRPKMVIAGGRKYVLTDEDKAWLDEIHSRINIGEVVSGGAKGADYGGEKWAKENNIPAKKYEAAWHVYGHGAGPRRNEKMAKYCDGVILFPGNDGTADMKHKGLKYQRCIYERKKDDYKEILFN